MRRPLVALSLVLLAAGASFAADVRLPDAEWLLDEVKELAAPGMAGRAAGTPGADRAAALVARVFKDAGLRPGGERGYLQPFDVPTGVKLGTPTSLALVAPSRRDAVLGSEFVPLAVSSDGDETADVVFVGYGITAPALGYDDYAGVDVGGKLVLALTDEPRGGDPASPFRRPEAYHFSERSHKIINAREHGARGIVLVPRLRRDPAALPTLRGVSQPSGILAAVVAAPVAESWVAAAGLRLTDLADEIDATLTPRSRPLTGVRAHLRITLLRERGTTANVVGVLPGTDLALRGEAVIIGAHYDHLGHGGEGSLAPDRVGDIHPGADDNASGTAAMMALARGFAGSGGAPRTLVFVAFAAEEMGLLGSAHYAAHPAVAIDRSVLMVNLDMVGRLRDGRLYVGGVDSGSGLRAVVEAAARAVGLAAELRADPFAPSDHTTFYTAGRPVLFFFTGAHPDYHRPTDTWDRIDARGLRTVVDVAARVISAVASQPAAPRYVKIETPAAGRPRGSYGPFFGVVPDFSGAPGEGVRVGGVRPGSPAEKAGVRTGDVIRRFGAVTVKTLEDLTFALRGHRAGDRVGVVVERDGGEQQVDAVLEERR